MGPGETKLMGFGDKFVYVNRELLSQVVVYWSTQERCQRMHSEWLASRLTTSYICWENAMSTHASSKKNSFCMFSDSPEQCAACSLDPRCWEETKSLRCSNLCQTRTDILNPCARRINWARLLWCWPRETLAAVNRIPSGNPAGRNRRRSTATYRFVWSFFFSCALAGPTYRLLPGNNRSWSYSRQRYVVGAS